MIPKIIHYCWLSDEPVPEKFQKFMNTWKELLPDYEFIKWDFSKFDKDSSDWVSEAFAHKKYACASDYIRLYAIYYYGGIYLDMDIEMIKPFGELLNKTYMFAYENPSGAGIEAGCFGAEKGDSFLKACLERYKGRHYVLEDGSFDRTILPVVMKKCLEDEKFNYKVYNHNYFTAKSFETGRIKITDETYCVHHFAGTWKTKEEKDFIHEMNRLSRIFGIKIGRNLAEYRYEISKNGFHGAVSLTKDKINRKRNK